MSVYLDTNGFGTEWNGLTTDRYEGYLPRMTDYHMHDYYEISLIISGNVRVLLPGLAESSTESRLVLMRPRTPHFIVCEPNMLYKRRNILFSGDFIANYVPEWQRLLSVFGKDGTVQHISDGECAEYVELTEKLERETDPFRQRLLLLMFLSLLADRMEETGKITEPPAHVTGALLHITEHYAERIVASELAWRLGVGRTTLMTSFKRYTGTTVNEYVLQCRIKNAVRLLRGGMTEQQTAEACGFSDACNLIRSFKRCFQMTPKQYLAANG
ncbi:MAG: helix-turn-helix transcriptional regulator [Clostridia bacterium]|nr:helix-turn-helix transcriptional regulator [Clostridia bacterium]